MANRFRAAVKTTKIKVVRTDFTFDENGNETARVEVPTFEYETRFQGQGSIIRRAASHDGLDAIIEDAVDSLVKHTKGKSGDRGAIVKAIIADLESQDLSIGAIAAKVIRNFPDLVAELIADGAVLQDGETVDDFVEWLESLTLSEIISVMKQWYAFNFVGGLGPLVRELAANFGAGRQSEKKAQTSAAPARPMGLRRAG